MTPQRIDAALAEPITALPDTKTATLTDLQVIESLDFEPDRVCDFPKSHPAGINGHAGEAVYLIRVQGQCPNCKYAKDAHLAICKGAYDYAGLAGMICRRPCNQRFEREEWWTIVGSL